MILKKQRNSFCIIRGVLVSDEDATSYDFD